MSSELDNENSLNFSTPPEKIDPRDTPLLEEGLGEEKADPPKAATDELVSSSSSAGHFYRDVYSSSPEEEIDLEAEDEDKFIEIAVSEPHKVGEGISCYMAYKVSTKTNLKIFRRESFSVTRRFSDFLGKLHRSATWFWPIVLIPIYGYQLLICQLIPKKWKILKKNLFFRPTRETR